MVDVILEAAADALEQGGFAGYNTNAIAERAGVSVGSLYQYFPNKHAVSVALIERDSDPLVRDVDEALAQADPGRALQAMIDAVIAHQLRRPRLARLLDLEQARLATEMPESGNAIAIRDSIAAFLARHHGLAGPEATDAAGDVMAVTRALTDRAGGREAFDPGRLRARIEGVISGYLTRL